MLLFDEGPRTYTGPSEYAEGSLSFYGRSARPEVGRVRELIEQWLQSYPIDARRELIARMREDFGSFSAAFFELFVHQLLVATGHDVEPHPVIDGSDKRPDFRATPRKAGEPCYVEAITVSAESADRQRERRLHARIQDDLNAFRHPDFFFHIARLDGSPTEYPKRAEMHRFLRDALHGLDAAEIAARIESAESIDQSLRRRYLHKGMTLEVYPWPKSERNRGRTDLRTIGAGPIRIIRSTAREAIRDAIKTKARRYGDLPHPYLVAVNCTAEWGVDDHEPPEALLGAEEVRWNEDGSHQLAYSGEGAFAHRSRPTNTRVSGALVFRNLTPPSVTRADPRLFHHFAAKRPYSGPLDVLPHSRLQEGVLRDSEGTADVALLLGLWPEWPFDSGDRRGMGWKYFAADGTSKD
jgi:hypothetical protein